MIIHEHKIEIDNVLMIESWSGVSAGMTVRGLACTQLPQELSAITIKRFNLDIQELSESPLDISSSNSFPNSNAGNGRSSSFLTGPSV